MHHDGGYAEYMTVNESFVHPIPDEVDPALAAPLLCAGAVGYRSLRMAQLSDGQNLGLTGFGASGQLVMKMAQVLYPGTAVYVFARSEIERKRALDLGAAWAGDTLEVAPVALSAIIDTTPAWTPVMAALEQLEPGGKLVINAIRKEYHDQSRLQDLDYARHLWLEKSIQSVANVTRRDVREMLELAARYPLASQVKEFPLENALQALLSIRQGHISQPCVLRINPATL
jgi:propanol-preferring alcohol dehydrogenase